MTRLSKRSPLICLLVAAPMTALAQGVPDAGALREQIERPLETPALPGSSAPLEAEVGPQLALPEGVTLTVNTFRFSGNTLLTESQLQSVVQRWIGRPIGFAELHQASRAIATAYRSAGWIVRTLLPQQDVTEGVVTIQIIESRFAGARIEADEMPTRVRPDVVLRTVESVQRTGTPLSVGAIDRALLLADDLPGVVVLGALEPGSKPGETALQLHVQDDSLIDGSATVDNGGARSTGTGRALVTANLQSPLRLGDRARADLLASEGARYGRLGYNLPIGGEGWRAGANVSYFDYELVSSPFAGLDAHGSSSSYGLDASYPIHRARLRNLYLTLAADQRNYRNLANGAVQSDYDIASFTAGLAGNLFDTKFGGGSNSFSLNFVHGRVRQGTTDVGENPVYDGNFWKVRWALTREQIVTSSLTIHAHFSGQYASEALDSAERFYLGGPDGARGYDVNDGGGSRSELVQLELLWRVMPTLVATVFTDYGHTRNFTEGADQSLRNVGAQLTWTAPRSVKVDATFSRQRLWLQASIPF
ncbi:MAG: ShlB/FhaC/HecB family hemolysin secretion/activation protein [Steroidobacteraceae bacterium]